MKKKHTAEEKQNWQDPLLRTAITVEEIENLAAQIRVGDKIKWEVLDSDITSQKGYRKKLVTLTVTRKSRYLLEAADSKDRIYSIRYAELAEAGHCSHYRPDLEQEETEDEARFKNLQSESGRCS